MKQPVKINNIIFDRTRVLWLQYDEKDSRKVTVQFTDGQHVVFTGDEAIECWKEFDTEPDWRDSD